MPPAAYWQPSAHGRRAKEGMALPWKFFVHGVPQEWEGCWEDVPEEVTVV